MQGKDKSMSTRVNLVVKRLNLVQKAKYVVSVKATCSIFLEND